MCPFLGSLCLDGCVGLGSIEVSSSSNPHLKNLKVDVGNTAVVVDVPGLESFHFTGNIVNLCLKGAPPLLREACIRSDGWDTSWSKRQWKKTMWAISRVEILCVNDWFFEFLAVAGIRDGKFVFGNLKELLWYDDLIADSDLDAFSSFLGGCPQLEKLYIHLLHPPGVSVEDRREYSFDEDAEGEQPPGDWDHSAHQRVGEESLEEPMSKSALPRLKSATVIELSQRLREMRLVELLLQKAKALEQLMLHFISKRRKGTHVMRDKVSRMPAASPLVQISVEIGSIFDRLAFDLLPWRHSWAF